MNLHPRALRGAVRGDPPSSGGETGPGPSPAQHPRLPPPAFHSRPSPRHAWPARSHVAPAPRGPRPPWVGSAPPRGGTCAAAAAAALRPRPGAQRLTRSGARPARPPAALWAVTRPPPPLTGQLSHEGLRHQRHVAAGGQEGGSRPRARTGTGRRAAGAATASGARPAPAARGGAPRPPPPPPRSGGGRRAGVPRLVGVQSRGFPRSRRLTGSGGNP